MRARRLRLGNGSEPSAFKVLHYNEDKTDHRSMDTMIGDGTTGRYEEPNEKTVRLVAEKFSRLLRDYLEPEQMVEVENHDDPNTCKSHEYLDANMVMDEAIEDVTGDAFDLDCSRDEQNNETKLINRAWTLAREENFAF